jgi:predicted SAM-dependent methyltransferase
MNKESLKKAVGIKTKPKVPIMLNIGCGTDYKKGWINIDNNSDNNIDKLDLNWDLRNPLPYKKNSVDYIFNEHFIEHLTVEEAQVVIKDLMRVLKPGGVLRIAMPNLAETVDDYLNLPIKDDPVIKRFKLTYIKTRAERINIAFREWGHKWLYDAEELKRRLREAGCKNIKQCQLRKSTHVNLRNLEVREESTLIMEVTK